MSDTARALRRAPAPLALMGLIFFLSAQPNPPGPELGAWANVLAHFAEYAALAALWAWALAPAARHRTIAIAAAIAFAYALADEFHQSFVPGRDADAFDIAVDAVGIAVALALVSRTAQSRHH